MFLFVGPPFGLFESETFEEWFLSLALPALKRRNNTKVLIGDNLSSHMNINVIRTCQENEIKFVGLPPNATDYLQPFGVAFFAPMKRN